MKWNGTNGKLCETHFVCVTQGKLNENHINSQENES